MALSYAQKGDVTNIMGTWSTFTPRSYANACKPNKSVVPFRSRILKTEEHLDSLLPASYFAKHAGFRDALQKDIISPPKVDEEFLNAELSQGRLYELVNRLWIAGKPTPPNALHFQPFLGRDIIVVESMDLHLVCSHTQFYAKPIPPFLLEPSFWTQNLSCRDGCDCSDNPSNSCSRRTLWKSALGFLYSYRALIRHESDFCLAQDNYCYQNVSNGQIGNASSQTSTPNTQMAKSTRGSCTALRRSRLNKLQSIPSNFRETTYVPRWYRHGEFFRDNFAWLASATVYIAIILTAMQLGLATDALEENALCSLRYVRVHRLRHHRALGRGRSDHRALRMSHGGAHDLRR